MSIKVENLTKTYKVKGGADVAALKGISFNLPDTGMIFILGKSGCGKSTLLNLLGGLDSFDSGDIVVDGKSMNGYKARDYDRYRNEYVGFVFQENNLLEAYTVKRNIGLAIDLQCQKHAEDKITKVLESVELKDFEQRKCNSISGGQKQRVAIARALIKEPKMLLCDEPTGALDSETGAGIFTLLKQICKSTLVIVVSHDRESAETYGDRIIELKDGNVISDSAPLSEITEKETQAKNSKVRLNFKRALELGTSYIFARPIRFVLCALLCLITFVSIGVADTVRAYTWENAVVNTMNYLNSEHYTFRRGGVTKEGYRHERNSVYYGSAEQFDNELIPLLNVSRVDKIYLPFTLTRTISLYWTEITIDFRSLYIHEMVDESNKFTSTRWYWIDGYTEADESFLKDYNFSLVAGTLPKTYDEVVIPLHIFKGFSLLGFNPYDEDEVNEPDELPKINAYEDIIGRTISVLGKEFKVTGILDTRFADKYTKIVYEGGYRTTAQVTEIEDYLDEEMHTKLFFVKGFHDDYIINEILKYRTSEYWNEMYNVFNFEGVIVPVEPTAENLEDIVYVIAPYTGSNATKLANIKVYQNRFSREVYVGWGRYDTANYCYDIFNLPSKTIRDVNNELVRLSGIFLYVVLAMVIITVLYLLYYAIGTITDKQKEIGVLRAMGATRFDILKIFICEHGLFTGVMIILSAIVALILTVTANNYLTAGLGITAVLISFGIRQVAVIAGVAVLAVCVGVAIPIIKLLKSKPVDIIAGRK